MTPSPTRVQLTVEEALEFQNFDARLAGFIAGASSMCDYARRLKIDEILGARKAPPAEPPPNGI